MANTAGDAEGLDFEELLGEEEAERELPPYACSYCHIYDPACVVKCMESGKPMLLCAVVTDFFDFLHHTRFQSDHCWFQKSD